jgi:hypothetical protein
MKKTAWIVTEAHKEVFPCRNGAVPFWGLHCFISVGFQLSFVL